MNELRIAVLGAGGLGVCTALELAGRGFRVDLYDENPQPLTRASVNNEGKVHLGLVYAKDTSLRTARTMILGAIHFTTCLKRWIDFSPDEHSISTPFYYAVHKATMTSTDDVERHYEQCKRLFAEACDMTGLSYLGGDRLMLAERLSARERDAVVSNEYCVAAFRTSERAVDPRIVGDKLRAAACANPRIRFISNAQVSSATRTESNKIRISYRLNGSEYTEPYDQVANTLWHGRLAIDTTHGLRPERDWLYRYKIGGWVNTPIQQDGVPSITFVLGPFGDTVNFGSRGLYFSWYPAGMIGSSRELTPPDWRTGLSNEDRQSILENSFAELMKRCPRLELVPYSPEAVAAAGGVIFAWGSTDIDVNNSGLHSRYDIGIYSVHNYHTVNTGKYTMIPYLAQKTAERILGIS